LPKLTFFQSNAQGSGETGVKTCRNSQKFTEIHKKQPEINEKAQVLSVFFLPPCANGAKKE